MVIILFRSKLTPAAGEDYAAMNAELETSVQKMSGFVAVKHFNAADGERLTVVWWRDRETLSAWQTDQRHLVAKGAGRKDWYQYYKIELADVFRHSTFEKSELGSSSEV